MHKKFLKILACPHDLSTLKLNSWDVGSNGNIETGVLVCKKKHKFKIDKGIPRFVSTEDYSASFGFEWKKWPLVQFEDQNKNTAMAGHTTRRFKEVTGFDKKTIYKKMVVEFGCGAGRFLDIIESWEGSAVGLEMSSAIDQARVNFDDRKNILLVQGDLLKPPFASRIFDYGYSIGVLHHTPDPQKGLTELARVVKKGGKVAVSVYSNLSSYNFPSLKVLRRIYQSGSGTFGEKFALNFAILYSYISAYLFYFPLAIFELIPKIGSGLSYIVRKYFIVVMMIPSRSWRILDTFDAVTPKIANTFTTSEVKNWFNAAKIKDVRITRGETAMVGVKS